MKDQTDSDKALREGNRIIACSGERGPAWSQYSDGHLSTKHFGGRGCNAIE